MPRSPACAECGRSGAAAAGDYPDGFIRLASADTALSIEVTAQGNDVVAMMVATSTSTRQQWEMMPVGDGRWFLLRNRATGNCLDNIGNLTAGAAVRLWSCGIRPNQQWQLVR